MNALNGLLRSDEAGRSSTFTDLTKSATNLVVAYNQHQDVQLLKKIHAKFQRLPAGGTAAGSFWLAETDWRSSSASHPHVKPVTQILLSDFMLQFYTSLALFMMAFLASIVLTIFVLSVLLLAYIYVGYPALILLMAKLFRRPVHKASTVPSVTIVIPTFNEEVVIAEKIENTLHLDYPQDRLQILVCDDASEDRTVEIVKSYAWAGVELSQGTARSGKVGGLNRALQLATGEIFVIADADILPSPDALRELIANFGDEAVGCVMAQTKMASSGEGAGGGLYWRYEARIRQSESDIHSTVAATGHFMALRRKLLQPIPMDVILDDFYLAMMTIRQGYRVISEPQAIVWERPTQSMGDEVNRRSRLTAGRFQIIRMSRDYLPYLPLLLQFQVISHKFLRLAIPHLMIAALLSNLFYVLISIGTGPSSFLSLVMNGALLLQGIFYGLAIAGKVLFGKLSRQSKLIKALMLPYYLCATNFAGIAGLAKFVSGKRTVLWQQASRR